MGSSETTDFTFVYSTEEVKNVKVEKLIVNHEKIADVLDKCLKGSGLTYTVHEGVIAIKPASKVEAVAAPQQEVKVNGSVVDETGESVIGANVLVKVLPTVVPPIWTGISLLMWIICLLL